MSHTEVQIKTQDGTCPTHVYTPPSEGQGPWPAVIVFEDAIGIRPAMMEIAERIASAGYYVLLPNLFYRVGFTAGDPKTLFSDPETRKDLMTRIMPSASPANVARDMEALLAFLDEQPQADAGKIGVVGYCMGGRLALYVAGQFGDRIAAVGAYHAGGVATDAPDSPHRFAGNIKARVYVGGAIEDANFDDAQKARLEQALSDAGVEHTVETYNARHGYVMRDMPVYDEAATQRHWKTLLDLFGRSLGEGAAQPV
jgi:carboxymethylenebutenolidase